MGDIITFNASGIRVNTQVANYGGNSIHWNWNMPYNGDIRFNMFMNGVIRLSVRNYGVDVGGTLSVDGATSLKDLNIAGNTTNQQTLTVNGATSLKDLNIAGNTINQQALTTNGFLSALGGSSLVIQNNIDGGSTRAIRFWGNDNLFAMYMGQSGALKSLANGTACAGFNFTTHAIRTRVNNSATQGILFENTGETCLMSIRGSDGSAYFNSDMKLNGLLTTGNLITAGTTGTITTGNITLNNSGSTLNIGGGTCKIVGFSTELQDFCIRKYWYDTNNNPMMILNTSQQRVANQYNLTVNGSFNTGAITASGLITSATSTTTGLLTAGNIITAGTLNLGNYGGDLGSAGRLAMGDIITFNAAGIRVNTQVANYGGNSIHWNWTMPYNGDTRLIVNMNGIARLSVRNYGLEITGTITSTGAITSDSLTTNNITTTGITTTTMAPTTNQIGNYIKTDYLSSSVVSRNSSAPIVAIGSGIKGGSFFGQLDYVLLGPASPLQNYTITIAIRGVSLYPYEVYKHCDTTTHITTTSIQYPKSHSFVVSIAENIQDYYFILTWSNSAVTTATINEHSLKLMRIW
jgi:hypothetical protein